MLQNIKMLRINKYLSYAECDCVINFQFFFLEIKNEKKKTHFNVFYSCNTIIGRNF